MKATPFWILMACSLVIGILLYKEVSLSRSLYQQERTLGDTEQSAASATTYENAWKQLAIRIYQVGHQDAALMAVLKSENIGIHPSASPGAESTPPADAPPAAPAKPQGTLPPLVPAAGAATP